MLLESKIPIFQLHRILFRHSWTPWPVRFNFGFPTTSAEIGRMEEHDVDTVLQQLGLQTTVPTTLAGKKRQLRMHIGLRSQIERSAWRAQTKTVSIDYDSLWIMWSTKRITSSTKVMGCGARRLNQRLISLQRLYTGSTLQVFPVLLAASSRINATSSRSWWVSVLFYR